MAFFVWADNYSVGIQPMDDQHKQLVEMVDRLYEAMKSGRGNEILGTLFSNLLAYTRTHFAEEEALMQQCGYPGLAEHRQLHEQLTQQVLQMAEQFQSGRGSLTVQMATFLKEWLVNHIQGTDKKYAPAMREISRQ
jgi:hemerythrin